MATNPISSDVPSLLNPTTAPGRKVTADINGTDVQSKVDSAGDQKLFEQGTKQLGKQDFLQLLVTQMRFQDPMAPQDNQQFISQLAQFSALEGTNNISSSIDDLGKKIQTMLDSKNPATASVDPASATSLIGKTVRVNAEDVLWDPAQTAPVDINVHVDAGTDSVLSVVDGNQKVVRVIQLSGTGEATLQWDGKDGTGTKAPIGKYSLKVTSKDGTTDTGYTYFEDKVTGVGYGKTGSRVEVKGQSIALDQIMHVADSE